MPGKKIRTDWQERYLELLAEGATKKDAAREVGVSRQTAHNEMQRNEAFALAVHDVAEEGIDRIEAKGHELALAGNEKLIMFFLRTRRREVYGDQLDVRHSGRVVHELRDKTDEELRALADGLAERVA